MYLKISRNKDLFQSQFLLFGSSIPKAWLLTLIHRRLLGLNFQMNRLYWQGLEIAEMPVVPLLKLA